MLSRRLSSHGVGHRCPTVVDCPAARNGRTGTMTALSESGRWREVAAVLLGEARRLDDAAARAEKLVEVGDLYRDRLDAPADASAHYLEAVRTAPEASRKALSRLAQLARETGDVDVTTHLVAALSHTGHWDDVVTVLVRQAEGSADPEERAGLLLEAARACQHRLRDPDRARRHLLAAAADAGPTMRGEVVEELRVHLAARPDDEEAAVAVARLVTALGRPLEAVSALTRGAAHVRDLPRKAALLLDAAILCADRIGQPVDALVHLYEALVLDPALEARVLARMDGVFERWRHVPEVVESLENIYARLGRSQKVHEVLRARYESAPSEDQPALLLRLAEHAEYQLLDPAEAFDLYRRGLEHGGGEPAAFVAGMRRVGAEGVPGAVEAMCDLFGRLGLWRALVHVLEDEAAVQADDAARADLHFRAGEVLETHLEDLEGAMDRYQRAFKLAPQEPRYLAAGERVYRRRGEWRMVDRLLGMQVRLATEREPRHRLLLEQARVRHRHLGRPLPAYDAVRAALADGVAAPAMALLADLVRDDAAFAEIERGLRDRAADEGATAASRLLLELAALHIDLRERPAEGLAALREAADLHPGDARLFTRVADVHAQLGDEEGLAAWLATAADRPLPDEVRLDAVRRAAALWCGPLQRPARGRDAWRRVAALGGAGPETFAALLAAARAADEPRALAAILEEALLEEALLAEPASPDREAWLRELAETREALGDRAGAAECWHAVLDAQPLDEPALDALRRWYTERAAWEPLRTALAAAAEARQIRDGEPDEGLVRELAELAEHRLGDLRLAAVYLEPLARREAPPGALHAELRRLYEAAGDREGALGLLGLELDAAPTNALRAATAERLVELAAQPPVDVAALSRGYEALTALHPDDLSLLDAWIDHLRVSGDAALLADMLHRRWSCAPEPAALPLLRERARLLAGPLDRPDDAAEAWRAVLAEVPADLDALAALQVLEEARGDDEAVLALLLRRHAALLGEPPAARRAVLREAAVVAEVRLGDAARAIDVWLRALGDEPDLDEAQDELLRLYAELARWTDFVALGERRLPALDLADRVDLARRLARVTADELGRPRDAERFWRAVCDAAPDDPEALAALVDAALARGEPQDAEALLGRLAAAARDPAARLAALESRVDVLVRLDRLAEAIEVLGEIRALVPDDRGPVRRQRELALRRKDWWTAARALDAERRFATDDAERLEIDRALARLYDEELGDQKAAAAAWERVTARAPADLEALRALKSLYVDLERPDDLVRVLRTLLEHAPDDAARVRLLIEAAGLVESLRGDLAEAFECWWRAFRLCEQPRADLLGEMRRLAEAGDLWPRYLEVLDAARARAREPEERANILLQQAEVAERRLDDAARAFELCRAAFDLNPAEGRALSEMERLAERTGGWGPVVEAWRTVADAAERPRRVALLVRAADVCEARLGQPEEAFALLARAATGEPKLGEALVDFAERHRLWDALIGVYTTRWQSQSQTAARIATLHHLARVLEQRAGDWERAFEQYVLALQLDPRDEATRREAWRLAEAHHTWPIIARVFELKAEDAPETWLKIALLQDLARLQGERLGEPRRAFDTLRKAFSVEPWNAQTHAALRELAARLGAWRELAALLEEEAGWAEERHARLRLYREAADILRAHGDGGEAARILRHVAELAPEDEEVVDDLLELLREAGEPLTLAAALERHARNADEDRRVRLLAELAGLYAGPLKAPAKAEQVLHRLVTLRPDDGELFDSLAAALEARGAWAALADLLDQRIPRVLEGDRRRALLRRRADLLRTHLSRGPEAWRLLLQVAREEPEDLDLLFELAARPEAADAWADLLACAERSADVADPERLPDVLMLAGRIARDRFKNEKKARQALGRALELRPGDVGLAREVADLLRRGRRFQELVDLCRRVGPTIVAGADEDPAAPAVRARWTLEVAGLQADRLFHVEQAVETLRRAAEDGTAELEVLRRLRQLAERAQEGAVLQDAVRALATALPDDEAAEELARGARALTALGELERAAALWRAALERAPNHSAAQEELRRFAERRRDWDLLVEQLSARAAGAATSEERAQLLCELGTVHRARRGDEAAAEAAWRGALGAVPGHLGALRSLVEVVRPRGDAATLDGLTDRLSARLRDPLPEDERRRTAPLVAELLLERARRAGEGPEALVWLREAHQHAADHREAARALGDALYAAGELAEAAAIYARLPAAGTDKGPEHLRRARAARAVGDGERALRHFEAAAQAAETRVAALEALANLHEEAGRWEAAVRLREKLAESVDAPRERAAALVAAGAIAETRLGRVGRAMTYYQRALDAGLTDRTMLRRILDLCAEHDRADPALRIVENLLIDEQDLNQRAELLCVRGDLLAAQGEVEAARTAYAEALDASPLLARAVRGLLGALGTAPGATQIEWLDRIRGILQGMPGRAKIPVLALVGERLQGLGRDFAALDVFEEIRALEPDHRGARDALAALYVRLGARHDLTDRDREAIERALVHELARLRGQPGAVDALRDLVVLYRAAGHPRRALTPLRLLARVGEPTDAERAALATLDDPLGEAPERLLDGARRTELVYAPGWRHPVGQLLRMLHDWIGPAIDERFGTALGEGGEPADVLQPPLAELTDTLARALDVPVRRLWLNNADDRTVTLARLHPPELLAGGGLTQDVPLAEQRFLIGRALELTRGPAVYAAYLPEGEARAICAAVVALALPDRGPEYAVQTGAASDRLEEWAEFLVDRLEARQLDALAQFAAPAAASGPRAFDEWAEAVRHSAHRVGFVLCGDLVVALDILRRESGLRLRLDDPDAFAEAIAKSPALADLYRYAFGPQYQELLAAAAR